MNEEKGHVYGLEIPILLSIFSKLLYNFSMIPEVFMKLTRWFYDVYGNKKDLD